MQSIQNLLQLLDTDATLATCFHRYTKDASAMQPASAQALTHQYRLAQDRQNTLHGTLDAEYARLSQEMLQKLMPLCLLHVRHPENQDVTACAVTLLQGLCDADSWVTQGKDEDRFHADLFTATVCLSLPVSFALLEDVLPQALQATCRQAVWEKGILPILEEWTDPFLHAHTLDTMGHNWFLVIVCAAAYAALSLQEADHDRYAHAQMQCIPLIRQWFRYPGHPYLPKEANFHADGGYEEYLGYLIYGLSSYALFEDAYRARTGDETLFEEMYLKPLPDQLIHFSRWTRDGMRLCNFGDASELMSKHQHVYYYLANRLHRPDLIGLQKQMTAGPNSWEDFLFFPSIASLPQIPAVPKTMFLLPQSGLAQARSGHGQNERFFAMRASSSWNHNHLDAGTFILTDHGVNLAIDSGTCGYGLPEYRAYYTQSFAHNTLLLDVKGQDSDQFLSGTHGNGRIQDALDLPDFQYIQADCTLPYQGVFRRFLRHVVLLKDWTILIDDVQTPAPAHVTFQLHTETEPVLHEGYATLQNDQDFATVVPLYPSCDLRLRETFKSADRLSLLGPHAPLTFEDGLPKSKSVDITYFCAHPRGKLITAISRIGHDTPVFPSLKDHGNALEITLDGESLLVNLRADGSVMHANSWLTTPDVKTDAFLVYQRHDCTAMVYGSYLETASLQLGCLSKVSLGLPSDLLVSSAYAPTELSVKVKQQLHCYALAQGLNIHRER